jgi:hypothetical protein
MLEGFVNQAASVSSAVVIPAVEVYDASWNRHVDLEAGSSVIPAVADVVAPAFHTKITLTQTF